MCFSGKCAYETYMGDCRITDFDIIQKTTGHSACYIDGQTTYPGEQDLWDEDYELGNITQWRNKIRENKLWWIFW